MAANPIEAAFDGLMLQSQRAYNGASALGASLPIVINTAALIAADRNAVRAAQTLYRGNRGDLDPFYETLHTAMADSRVYATRARDTLKKWCGPRFNITWIPTGFTKNTQIPKSEPALTALIEDLGSFYTTHTDHEVPDLGVTAAAANALLTRLQNARDAIDTKKMTCVQCREDRDTKFNALRKRLSGLCKELSQRLGPLDGRWRDFGFNLPGAPATPAVPKNLSVDNHTPLQFLVACDPSPNATGYRFYYQRPIADPEPIWAGSATDPLFVITGLTAGQNYQVFVSATNEGAESELSEPVTATALAVAAA